eukprot:TRINITY_DN78_c0_g1_i3.p1 TRINITY_DN78_c0_g1~~TRINITY_DN78_c0_g1_i3.p1  ORF type:complete len:238 (+),score=74.40 TRINITY_DN78_c0_g1_i3:61-714(+)
MEQKPLFNTDGTCIQNAYSQGGTVVVPVASTFEIASGDYRPSCVGSAICPLCGCLGTLMCCNTLSGKHGVADGCKISMTIGVVFAIIIGILVVASAVNCQDDMTAGNTNMDDCDDISGAYWNYTDDKCYFNGHCPSKYTYKDTVKDDVLGWCKNDDHYTCLGMQNKLQPWIDAIVYGALLILAIKRAQRYYEERLAQHNQAATTPIVYGTPVPAVHV